MLLSEIAQINSGYLFRSRIKHTEEGKYQVVQMKDIKADNSIDTSSLLKVELDSVKNEQILKQGDILFKARGQQNYASVVDDVLENTIASSHFFVLRVCDTSSITPAYLAWYINQKQAQQYFGQIAAGTRIKHINMNSLGRLNVVLPPMDVQERIVKLYKLGLKEQQIIKSVMEKRNTLLEASLSKRIRQL